VIESVMLGALGFLVATLLWLLALPAIARRADRLARRRAELTFPLSLSEVAAERDHLRAAHAVREQALLRQVDETTAARAEALATLGARDARIAALAETVEARETRIGELDGQLSETQGALDDTRGRLAAEEAEHARTTADLGVARQGLAERDRDIGELRVARADLTAEVKWLSDELAQSRTLAEATGAALSALKLEHAALSAAHDALGMEKDRLRIALAEAETISLGRATRIDDLAGQLEAERRKAAELSDGLRRVEEEARQVTKARDGLAAKLSDAQRRLDDATARLAALGTDHQQARARLDALARERDDLAVRLHEASAARARAEAERASARREAQTHAAGLGAELEGAQAAAAAARAEKAELRREVARLRREAERSQERLALENAELRGEITRVADAMLARAHSAAPSAAQSVVPTGLAASPPPPPGAPANDGERPRRTADFGSAAERPRRRARLAPPPAAE
jgi:chromosome segregation ATPase